MLQMASVAKVALVNAGGLQFFLNLSVGLHARMSAAHMLELICKD